MDQSLSPNPALAALAPELAARVGQIMDNLKALIARRFLKMPLFYPLIMPLWKRLNRIARRLKRAMELGDAPPRVGKSRADKSQAGQERRVRAVAVVRLPQKFGWLIWTLGWEAAGYAGHLEYLLQQPEVAAVMAACPRARRVLRPIARMLALRLLDPVKAKPVAVPENVPISDAGDLGGEGLGAAVGANFVKS